MNQHEFKQLTTNEQLELLWQFGFVIGARKDNMYSYLFYTVNDFYAEVKYQDTFVKNIQEYKSPKRLLLYPTKSTLANH